MKIFFKDNFIYNQKEHFDKLALSYMKDCCRILDIGCGTGRFISNDPKRIIGIDHNEDTIKLCKGKGYEVYSGLAVKLPFNDESFDAVHCAHIIEHLMPQDAYKLLKEINRVLKTGGVACIRTPFLHDNFYNDLTHIKPYHPKAILHYLKISDRSQRTLSDIECLYKLLLLKYRKQELFFGTTNRFLGLVSRFLAKLGISTFRKNGYILILKKIK